TSIQDDMPILLRSSTSSSSEPSTPQPQESPCSSPCKQTIDYDYKIDKQEDDHITQTTQKFDLFDISSNTRHRTSLVSINAPPIYTISRYLPQNQAIITTQDNWRISLSNHIANLMFSGVTKKEDTHSFIGKLILDYIDINHRPILLNKIVKRREDLPRQTSTNGNVLICGDAIPILKQDGTRSLASLWLKEKKSENGSSIFIWIFEEVFQSSIKIRLDNQNIIQSFDSSEHVIQELLGYSFAELIHQPIQQFIPYFDAAHKFFGCRTKLNAKFPAMLNHIQPNMIRVTSMPTLSSLVIVDRYSGMIQSCDSTTFSKHLFGYEQLSHMFLSKLLPSFPTLMACLERDQLLQHDFVLNHSVCRDVLKNATKQDTITALHRDGTLFEIEIQIELSSDNHKLCAVWITFDRDTVLQRHGHVLYQGSSKKQEGSEYEATMPNVIRSKSINLPTFQAAQKKATRMIVPTLHTPILLQQQQQQQQQQQEPQTPANKISRFSRPSFSRHSTHGLISKTSLWPQLGEYSAQTQKISIHDYEILDELGQGAYGFVKLAYLKSDPEKKRVVIKYVIKSRILVDCWTRDRKLGLIPAEIHVLHTLRKIPHINCSEMLDYFEDDDNYYVVMDLYGAGMDLFDYIEYKEGGMTESEIRTIFRQIIAAVSHLHSHRIVHRDIKDENVILDLKGGVRLIDFGSAAYVKEGKQYETFVGTLDYAAPEILNGKTYTGPPQDIWACGTLLYTLIYRENPFYNIDEIMQRELRIPFILSEESVDLIRKMLDRDVESRLTVEQVLAHP
ncbi:hypothetical protein CU098_002288, partial [Rhizopus stolonifer]